jgi:hypothetical protein
MFLMASSWEFSMRAMICSRRSGYSTQSGLMIAIVNGRFTCLGSNSAYSIMLVIFSIIAAFESPLSAAVTAGEK